MNLLAKLDHQFVWHPFTQMRDWLRREPIVIVAGDGAVLRDAKGREFLDANSSIWTNLHGHNHPEINSAIQNQLKKIAHSSALGFANEPASLVAEKLVEIANQNRDSAFSISDSQKDSPRKSKVENQKFEKVFFSDDGSTALEVALKLAYQFTLRMRKKKSPPKFLSLAGAYHGDTIGAVSLGHIDLFHENYRGLLFQTEKVMSPYCYRCPFNRAKPERDDARNYRQCNWECVGLVEQKFSAQRKTGNPFASFIVEPLMQGAAGMIPQPKTWLKQVSEIARAHDALLIADEVMTGFGRCGVQSLKSKVQSQTARKSSRSTFDLRLSTIFACQKENVWPDFLCVAKGLTGGYLPMAATLTTQKIFDAFLGEYDEFKTFFHGHSFTGNQLGASAALASLKILQSEESIRARENLEKNMRDELQSLWRLPNVGDIRQVGLIAGIELVKNWRTREAFALREQIGIRVCDAMARRGVLTRPIGNVIVLMPPFCTTQKQLQKMVAAIRESVEEIFPAKDFLKMPG
jgi:adenosylmethionine-8-amino-7-oxononanoate aminotransferase